MTIDTEPSHDISRRSRPLKRRRSRNTQNGDGLKRKRVASPEVDVSEETNEELAKQYKKFANAPRFNYNSEELFCVCRRIDDGEIMVACDGCEEWYHFKCMKINPELSNLIAKFFCKFCKWKGEGETLWKRKCRVEGCFAPIEGGSKYCSREHGKQYMERLILEKKDGLQQGQVRAILDFASNDCGKLQKLGSEFPELREVAELKTDEAALAKFPQPVQEKIKAADDRANVAAQELQREKSKKQGLMTTRENIKVLNDKISEMLFPDAKEQQQQQQQQSSVVSASSASSSSSKLKSSKSKKSKSKSKKRIELCMCDKSDEGWVNQIASSQGLLNELVAVIKRREEIKDREDQADSGDEEHPADDQIEDDQEKEQDKTVIDFDWFKGALCIKEKKKCHRHNGWWGLYCDEVDKALEQLQAKKEQLQQEKQAILRNYSIQVYEQ
ncbi:uncharacterized protein LODBEIA_P28750 [Lodderomyces beijingensis]|uniref:PHD-type domain-containing protein n=1 Tax=Lodderomyces beijingensis TaxID=1775926 RepID=A0ABP0ZKH6_9ASCO